MFEQLFSWLLEHKRDLGLTWNDISAESGVSLSLLHKLSSGDRTQVSLPTYEKIETYLEKQKTAA